MSYDVYAVCDHCGHSLTQWNYTSNCSRMWDAAGAPIRDWHGQLVIEVLPQLSAAIDELRAHPEKYKPMNPENGWGSYETLVPALNELLASLREVAAETPLAKVRVSR